MPPAPAAAPSLVILVMGVSGSGKTTVGRALAESLGWSFADADDFHPPANKQKMASGHPLDDVDRAPWLAALRAHIDDCLARRENAVVACSALKERYRAQLIADPARVRLVYLHGSPQLLRSRLEHRHGHFMPVDLLDSQFATLEPPAGALSLDVVPPPAELVKKIRAAFAL